MVIDRLARQVQPAGDSGIRQAFGEQLQDLDFAAGQLRRVGARGRARPARQAARATLAQLTRHPTCHGPGAEPLEGGERVAQMDLLIAFRQGSRRFVRATQLGPPQRGRDRVAGDLELVRLGCSWRQIARLEVACFPAPVAQLADVPGVVVMHCQIPGCSGFLSRFVSLPEQPGRFGARRAGRRQALERLCSHRQRQSFVQGRVHLGVATASAESPQRYQAHDASDRRDAWPVEDLAARVGALVPAALVQVRQPLPGPHIQTRMVQIAFAAEGDARREILVGARELIQLTRDRAQVAPRVDYEVVKASLLGHGSAGFEVEPTTLVAGEQQRRPDGVVGADERLDLAESFGQIDRLLTPGDRFSVVAIEHAHVCVPAIGVRKLTARGQCFQHSERCLHGGFRLGIATCDDQRRGEMRQCFACAQLVAQAAPDAQRGVPRFDRFVRSVGNRNFGSVGFQQFRAFDGLEHLASIERSSILGCRLAVRSQASPRGGCRRRELDQRLSIACFGSVVSQAGQAIRPRSPGPKRGQDTAVERRACGRGETSQYRFARQFVAERQTLRVRPQHPSGDAFVGCLQPAAGHLGRAATAQCVRRR